MKKTILIIEDDQPIVGLVVRFLNDENIELISRPNIKEGLVAVKLELPVLVLLDLNLPDGNGMDLLREIKRLQLPSEVIIMTAYGDVDIAVNAMNDGAFDFLEKPFTADRLIVSVRNALEHHSLYNKIVDIESIGQTQFSGFIGKSSEMQIVYNMIRNCASSKATVLIQGESGTGKEICANTIHDFSPRQERKFIPLNCAAIPADLMESEVFGYKKGAFTGALKDKPGLVELADGGTLFLDELGELNIDLQAKLLRFLQTGQYNKIGSGELQEADVRIVCATNCDLFQEVKKGNFREDLYYRLNVIQINLPPLRERGSDALLIADHYLNKYNAEEAKSFIEFEDRAKDCILNYEWPGNIRELQNIIRRIVVLNDGQEINIDMLPKELLENRSTYIPPAKNTKKSTDRIQTNQDIKNSIKPLWQVEREAIEEAIELCNDNIPQAAAMLDVSPSTIYRKKQSWSSLK